jgi:hypothetical protein
MSEPTRSPTGLAFAPDDGQALVLDQTSKGVRVVEADDAGHEVIARCAQPPVQVLGRKRRAVAAGAMINRCQPGPEAAPRLGVRWGSAPGTHKTSEIYATTVTWHHLP